MMPSMLCFKIAFTALVAMAISAIVARTEVVDEASPEWAKWTTIVTFFAGLVAAIGAMLTGVWLM